MLFEFVAVIVEDGHWPGAVLLWMYTEARMVAWLSPGEKPRVTKPEKRVALGELL
jgi:hypothetical protein